MPRYHCQCHYTSHHRNDSGPWTQGGVRVLASRYKTQLCRTFAAAGVCPYGAECMFAHGEHELRTRESNEADGLVSAAAVRDRQFCATPSTGGSQSPHGLGHTHTAATATTIATVSTVSADDQQQQHYHPPDAAVPHNTNTFIVTTAATTNKNIHTTRDRVAHPQPAVPSAWIGCSVRGRARYMHDPYRAAMTAAATATATLHDA